MPSSSRDNEGFRMMTLADTAIGERVYTNFFEHGERRLPRCSRS